MREHRLSRIGPRLPGGCDFCSTTALFNKKRIQLLSPEELVDHIHLYYKHFPEVTQVFIIEEDHFRFPKYLFKIKEHWEKHPDVAERLDWFGFGSIDHIGKFAKQYGWDAIAEIGLGALFIGVESKFAGEHGYDKRDEYDAREIFQRLHSMGIRTVGAWMCGWDFHNHGNIHEDLNFFVSLQPTYQQLTRVSPFREHRCGSVCARKAGCATSRGRTCTSGAAHRRTSHSRRTRR